MRKSFEIYLPLQNRGSAHKIEAAINEPLRKPFFSVSNDDGVVRRFLEAMKKERIDDAKIYLSKYLKAGDLMDLEELSRLFEGYGKYKYLRDNASNIGYENFRRDSVMIMDNEYRNSVLHLYLIKEPDKYSNWKIYGIERE